MDERREQPTNWELARNLGELKEVAKSTNAEIRGLRDEMAGSYVRKDVYLAELAPLRADVERLKERITTNFRLAMAGVIGPSIVAVVVWLLKRGGP